MAIASNQIGRSAEAQLLQQISKQIERLIGVVASGAVVTTTTTTTTEVPLIFTTTFTFSYPADYIRLLLKTNVQNCDDITIGTIPSEADLSPILNDVVGYLGVWSNDGNEVILTTTQSIIDLHNCPEPVTSIEFWQDI